MKRSLEAFLLRQLSNPMPARFLDLPRTALVLKRLTHEDRTYEGTTDWIEVQHAGKTGKMTRQMMGRPAETVVAPGSVVRKWREQNKVQLLHDESYESGPYDVYSLPDGRGYRHWDEAVRDDSVQYSIEPENEFSDLWVPIRRRRQSGWSEIHYVPWKTVTGWPLKGESGATGGFIDLSSALESQHRKMVANAY
jgi:hypothetical protein